MLSLLQKRRVYKKICMFLLICAKEMQESKPETNEIVTWEEWVRMRWKE